MQPQAQSSSNTLNVRRLDLVPRLRAPSFPEVLQCLGWALCPILRCPHHLSWLEKMWCCAGAMFLIHVSCGLRLVGEVGTLSVERNVSDGVSPGPATIDLPLASIVITAPNWQKELSRAAASHIAQLRLTHAPVNHCLNCIGKVDGARCPACGDETS